MDDTFLPDDELSLPDDSNFLASPVTPASIASQPVTPPVSDSIDKPATSALLGTMAQTTASNPQTVTATTTGTAVYPDDNGIPVVAIGQYGQTPDQMEAAGILKPGSAPLVNSMIAGGADPYDAMPPNLFTGKNGINSLDSYVNNPNAQATVAVTNLQQSQTQLTNAGVITGNEDSSQISGVVLAGATVGVPQTINAINTTNTVVPPNLNSSGVYSTSAPGGFGLNSQNDDSTGTSLTTYPNGTIPSIAGGINASNYNGSLTGVNNGLGGVSGSLTGSLSGSLNSTGTGSVSPGSALSAASGSKVLSTIKAGNFAAGSSTNSVLSGLTTSLSALSSVPSLSSLTKSTRGASASAFYAIASSFKPMQAGVPQNLTALSKQSALTTKAAGSTNSSSAITQGLNLAGSAIINSSGTSTTNSSYIQSASASGNFPSGINTPSTLSQYGASVSSIGYNSNPQIPPTATAFGSINTLTNTAQSNNSSLSSIAKSLNKGQLQTGVSSVASGISNLPGGLNSSASVVNKSYNSTSSVPGISSITNLTQTASAQSLSNLTPSNPLNGVSLSSLKNNNVSYAQSLNANLYYGDPTNDPALMSPTDIGSPDISQTLASTNGDLSALASTGLSPEDQASLQASISAMGGSGPSPVQIPTVAVNTNDRTELTDSIASTLNDPSIPAPDFIGEVSDTSIAEIDSIDQQQAQAVAAVDQLDTYNVQLSAAYDTYSQAVLTYPQGDPRIDIAYSNYQSLLTSPTLASLQSQING